MDELKFPWECQLTARMDDESQSTLPPISKKIVSVLYFKAFDKVIDGIADRFQQPDFVVHKNIHVFVDVFVKLRNRNNYSQFSSVEIS